MAWITTALLSHSAGWFLPQNQTKISALFSGHRGFLFWLPLACSGPNLVSLSHSLATERTQWEGKGFGGMSLGEKLFYTSSSSTELISQGLLGLCIQSLMWIEGRNVQPGHFREKKESPPLTPEHTGTWTLSSGSVTQICDQPFRSWSQDMGTLCCSFQLASPLSVSSGPCSPPCCEGVNPCKSINFRIITFGIEIVCVKTTFAYYTQHLSSHSLQNCASTSSPRQSSQSNKRSKPLYFASASASNCFLHNVGTICTALHKEPSLCLCFTGNVFLFALRVMKLKHRVGPSPMELVLESFFTRRANIK